MRGVTKAFEMINEDASMHRALHTSISTVIFTDRSGGGAVSSVRYTHWGEYSADQGWFKGRLLKTHGGRIHYAQPTSKRCFKHEVDIGDWVALIPTIRVEMVRTKVVALFP